MRTLWQLPGPAAWLESLAADVRAGASVIVACPTDDRPVDILTALADIAPRPEDHFALPNPDAPPTGLAPVAALHSLADKVAATIGVDPEPGSTSLDAIAHCWKFNLAIDARHLDNDAQSAWAGLVARIAESTRTQPSTIRPTFTLAVAPTAGVMPNLPRPDVTVRTRWWFGVLGAVDTALRAADLGIDADVAALATEVARWDLDLLADLAGWDGDPANLNHYLDPADHAGPAPIPADAPPAPPARLVCAWSEGLVESWDGVLASHVRLEAAHSPLAAARRAWAGQVSRVLPMIEIEARRLAEWFDHHVDGRVLDHWQGRIAGADVGELYSCIGDHWYQAGVACSAGRRRLINDLRLARNEIAHGRTIPPMQAADLRRRALADRST